MTRPNADIETAGAAPILDRLHAIITKYVILPSPEALDAVVLWVAASHGQPAWAHAPRLVIRAPEKRCGKSRLLDVIEGTCYSPLITVNASTPAVYRSIGGDDPPTILLDEADTIFGGKQAEANEDLRGLLNAGHQRNRPTIRWNQQKQQVERIATFAMAALAGIGQMPDTIVDRAVTEWRRLLKAAELRDARLHDARHTAATVLLVLEIAERAVMGIMGWSDSGMTKRYQHLTGQVRHDVAERVGGLLWRPSTDDRPEPDDGAAGVLVPAN